MCQQKMDASQHQRGESAGHGARQGASRGGCVWLRFTLWVSGLDAAWSGIHRPLSPVSGTTFQLVSLVAGHLITS